METTTRSVNEVNDGMKTKGGKFPLTVWEVTVASGVILGFVVGLYLTMPPSDYSFLKLPHSLQDLQILRDNLESYTSDYTIQVLVGYCIVYIFMQTFMIPGTVFVTVRAGIALGELQSIGGLYDLQSLATMFLIGLVSVTPTLMGSKTKS